MPHEHTHPVRGPLGTAFSAGMTVACTTNLFRKENLSTTEVGNLFIAAAIGGLIVGGLLPFFKKDSQLPGWDVINMREIKLAVEPIRYAASNFANKMLETAMLVTSLALGYALINYAQPGFIREPLLDLLWRDAAGAGIVFSFADTAMLLANFEKHFDISLTDSLKRFVTDCTPCCYSYEAGMRSTQQRLLLDNGDDHVINTGIVAPVDASNQA